MGMVTGDVMVTDFQVSSRVLSISYRTFQNHVTHPSPVTIRTGGRRVNLPLLAGNSGQRSRQVKNRG